MVSTKPRPGQDVRSIQMEAPRSVRIANASVDSLGYLGRDSRDFIVPIARERRSIDHDERGIFCERASATGFRDIEREPGHRGFPNAGRADEEHVGRR